MLVQDAKFIDLLLIRSPSPDFDDDDHGYVPKPILRSRNNSVGTSEGEAAATGSGAGTRSSSPEGGSGTVKSILKRSSRAAAAEDLGDSSEAAGVAVECLSGGTSGATSRSSPEPPHGILKQRKWSVGSAGTVTHRNDDT